MAELGHKERMLVRQKLLFSEPPNSLARAC
jgi:hypothetical protein